jgi:hypothetical protein
LCSCRSLFRLSLRWSLGVGCLSPVPLGVGNVALRGLETFNRSSATSRLAMSKAGYEDTYILQGPATAGSV